MYPTLYRFISGVYGQVRGYDRLRIQRAVWRNTKASASDLDLLSRRLFARRVVDALERFPRYAERVRHFRGSLPPPGEPLRPEDLPVWTRDDQKALFDDLDGPPAPGSYVHATGGSTGMPMRFYVTRESYEWRCAVSDRGYSLARAEEGRRSFYVWGSPVDRPGLLKRSKTDLHHRLQRRTYFDSFQFGNEQKAICCRMIDRCRPLSLVGYAGNLVDLARYVRDNPGQLTWKARTGVTAAEGLYPGQRELIEAYLVDELFMSYGSREFMLIGMECSGHRGYHVASDSLFVEVVDENGIPCLPGVSGRIVVTDLHNIGNPFIRYEIGDVGAMGEGPCSCGLPFPLLDRVDGRIQEYIDRPDGERLTALFIPHLMKEFPWIERYQVAQEASDSIEVRVVSNDDLADEKTMRVARKLRDKLGDGMRITFRRVEALTRSRTGKTPIVVRSE